VEPSVSVERPKMIRAVVYLSLFISLED